ncbi:hypothetical protein GY21_07440 [Cryobacterium roopkundense]|uniref:DUF1269 domain-containing protein n=1 Tax=Cryobacterium roopkundense TaxID=1001240 RepID=A0A099JIT4_9MICO|nr:DUF6325 family protein [Cryobacterium roopkundense]KGJ77532.1 hypothetical protein GY21_07440 [Cryobacterium roopkundense]MBB5640747.1 hypothetical protein [Cryobacterium roopkundense]
MSDFEYGPVELVLIGFDGDRPGPEVGQAVLDLVEEKTINLLDLVFVSKNLDGELRVLEIDELERGPLSGLALLERGLTGQEDVEALAEAVAPGASAAVLAVELVWAKNLAEALFRSGGRVLDSVRIPALVVNSILGDTVTDTVTD